MTVPELHLTRKDFRLEWFSGTGKGGQHRNKHQNCCRITHLASGLKAQGTSSRSRADNQRTAFRNLAARILAHYSLGDKERYRTPAAVVRNYHAVRNEVHDKRSGVKCLYTEMLEGDKLTEILEQNALLPDDEENA